MVKHSRGQSSRSYRFAEQFYALNNERAYESFLNYWDKHTPNYSTTEFLYLVTQFYPVNPADTRIKSRLLWAIKRS